MSLLKKIKNFFLGNIDLALLNFLQDHYFFSVSPNTFYKIKKNQWNIDLIVVSGNSFCNGDVYKYILIHCTDNTFKVYCVEKTQIYWILNDLKVKNNKIIEYNPGLLPKVNESNMELVYDSYNNLTSSANNL
jgi:hypothetical protein